MIWFRCVESRLSIPRSSSVLSGTPASESYLWACLQVPGITVTRRKSGGGSAQTPLCYTTDCFTHSQKEDGGITGQLILIENNAAGLGVMLLFVRTVYGMDLKVWGWRPHCVWKYHASKDATSDNGGEWETLNLNSLTLNHVNLITQFHLRCLQWNNNVGNNRRHKRRDSWPQTVK